jgi:integrase
VTHLALTAAVLPASLLYKASVLHEDFHPGDALDGSQGLHRVQRRGAELEHDLDAVRTWIRSYDDSPQTRRSYEKEAERLLRWCYFERGKPLSSLGAADVLAFFAFLADPPLHWIGSASAPRGSALWRPLRGPLKESSVRQSKAIVNALFTALVASKHLEGNPCALVRSRRASKPKRIDRFIKKDEWAFLRDWLDRLPEDTLAMKRENARRRHLIALVYLTAARLSDAAQGRMGHITRRDDSTWWWRVIGKGQKEDYLPITDELLASIRSYRVFHGLPPLPSPGEETPLVMRLAGPAKGGSPLSANMLHRIIKALFEHAARDAEGDGRSAIAAGLRLASMHWLRHTSLTHQVEAGIPLTSVRDNARHASIATTSRYLWTEDAERHQQTSSKLKLSKP